eukprot:CAMPEP_0172623478 /NCGR_PEP_ID=MMETSP1068-20121228/129018_1 /TAXON_ID=35684 /ORGANISM="Pseudopedinella elastica, Strain CCMP716" /LENGTH=165 /DNA_ID=CAMNT_0013432051 /DNA_START=368 /DNA_END=862 /DNA_ORIENTATION=+
MRRRRLSARRSNEPTVEVGGDAPRGGGSSETMPGSGTAAGSGDAGSGAAGSGAAGSGDAGSGAGAAASKRALEWAPTPTSPTSDLLCSVGTLASLSKRGASAPHADTGSCRKAAWASDSAAAWASDSAAAWASDSAPDSAADSAGGVGTAVSGARGGRAGARMAW